MSTPSLLNIPYLYKAGTLYSQIPESGAGDFTVTRATTPTAGRSTRINKDGLIELVADNVPRLDYPLGGAVNGCPALLVEPSAQNLLQRSEEFNDAYWSKVRCTASANQTTAPNGTLTADKLIMNNGESPTVNDMAGIYRSEAITSGAYRFSIFAKAAEFTGFKVRENTVNGNFMDVNLTNGAITNPDTTQFISPLAQNYGNGWYRISWTSPTITNLEKYSIRVGSTGDGASGIFIWGYQVETGSVATSYIPTTTAAVTRGAETISKTGVSSLIGQAEGTIYMEVDIRNMGKEVYLMRIDNNGNTNVIFLRTLTTNVVRNTIIAPTTSGNLNISSAAFTAGIVKIAFAYKSGEIALSVNGATALTTDGTFAFNAALSRIHLGSNVGANEFNDRIRAFEIYPNRIPNTAAAGVLSLATLTAP